MKRLLLGFPIILAMVLAGGAEAQDVVAVGALARIEPEHGIYNIAPPSSALDARIKQLMVEEGHRVQAGDVLATLDVEDVRRAERDLAVATVGRSEARLQLFRSRLARRQALVRANTISQESLEEVRSEFLVAQAALAEAQATLEKAEILLEDATVRAPTDGVVLRILVREGENASVPSGIIDFANTARMMAVAEVHESDIRHVAIGQEAEFHSVALPQPVRGRVERIRMGLERASVTPSDPTRHQETRVIQVYIALDDDMPVDHLINLQGEAVISTVGTTLSALQ